MTTPTIILMAIKLASVHELSVMSQLHHLAICHITFMAHPPNFTHCYPHLPEAMAQVCGLTKYTISPDIFGAQICEVQNLPILPHIQNRCGSKPQKVTI